MRAFFEIAGLNIYMQIAVTIISISVHLFATRNKVRRETVAEIVAIYTIGLAGWFGIMSGLFGHIIYADEVARGIGWPVDSGFQQNEGEDHVPIEDKPGVAGMEIAKLDNMQDVGQPRSPHERDLGDQKRFPK